MKPRSMSEKDPGELVVVTFDFGPDLAGDVLVGSPAVVCSVYSGADPSPAAVMDGAPQLDGTATMVLQAVQGGVPGVDYRLEATCATSTGRVLVVAGVLPVRDA